MMSLKSLFNASAIIDNNILIDLFELDSIELLFKVFGTVGILKSIIDEELDDRIKEQLDEFEYDVCVMDTAEAYQVYYDLTNNPRYKRLSKFDKHLISVAKSYDYYAGSNDGLIRKTCEDYSIKHVGTLGVIGCAFILGAIDRVRFISIISLLSSDITTCYIKSETINEFLNHVDIIINENEGGEANGYK